jgi:hypothetical protein
MTTLDEREQAFEEKFAHDEEIRSRVHALRNWLLGLWVAHELGLQPAEAEAYAATLAQPDVAKLRDDQIVNKVRTDFLVKGQLVSEDEVREELAALLLVAKRRIGGIV